MPLHDLRRVLVVSKRTRWEFASARYGVGGDQLAKVLESKGFPFERILNAHQSHHDALDRIVRALRRRGIVTGTVRAPALLGSDLDGIDAVVTAGGDGTVLEAASVIPNNRLPVITVNTDPKLSIGFLCSFSMPIKRSDPSFEQGVLDKLEANQYQRLYRRRIKVSFEKNQAPPHLSLNEIFFAEKDASRPTSHKTVVDSLPPFVQRSSGVIVCTGTGSTAWMSSASMISKPDLKRIFQMAHDDLTEAELNELCKKINDDCVFGPEDAKLQYYVREPVLNGWFGQHDDPLTGVPRRGFTTSLKLKSFAWDGRLTFDGIRHADVPYGECINIEVAPLDCSLFTVKFTG